MGRYIAFKDVIKQVPHNPLGRGANSYEYAQYLITNAFYESKYIHNALLQQLHDYGIAGALLFVVFACYSFYRIIKSSNPKRFFYGSAFVVIILHSMMNFNTAFPIIWIILSLITTWSTDEENYVGLKLQPKIVLLVILLAALPLGVYEASLQLANSSVHDENYSSALKTLTLPSSLNLNDDRIYFTKAAALKVKYDKVNSDETLKEVVTNLRLALKFNKVDPRIKWNLAYMLTKEKQYEEAEKLWKAVLEREGYNRDTYKAYYEFLSEAYADNQVEKAKKIEELRNFHEYMTVNRDKYAQFLSFQLRETLEETLKK
jgi:tetratricopeptide (TPR) repeat protein